MSLECDPVQARRMLFLGTMDDTNPLAKLRGNALVLSKIIDDVDDDFVRKRICQSSEAMSIIEIWPRTQLSIQVGMPACHRNDFTVAFPAPQDLKINMMPFKLFSPSTTLPPCCMPYLPMIGCCPLHALSLDEYKNRVAYLTVHESIVEPNKCQRRSGIHIERPKVLSKGQDRICTTKSDWEMYKSIAWGLGGWDDGYPIDGIYMASNVTGTCRVYPCLVEEPERVTDKHGGISDKFKGHLGEGRLLGAGELCWITDRTPHESLPLPTSNVTYRQFFRLVVGRVGAWYSKHNTANPMGILPDAPIVDDDKFM